MCCFSRAGVCTAATERELGAWELAGQTCGVSVSPELGLRHHFSHSCVAFSLDREPTVMDAQVALTPQGIWWRKHKSSMASEPLASPVTAAQEAMHKVTCKVTEQGLKIRLSQEGILHTAGWLLHAPAPSSLFLHLTCWLAASAPLRAKSQ